MTDLEKAIAALESAKEPNSKLNGRVLIALGYSHNNWSVFDPKGDQVARIPFVVGSLDATAELIEAMLPGRYWLASKGRDNPDEPLGGAAIYNGETPICHAEAATPALALCLAFLRALKIEKAKA